jgi:hypothetical protein
MQRPLLALLFLTASSLAQRIETLPLPPEDASAMIRKAIEAVPAHGGDIRLPAGRFLIYRPLVLQRDNITLRGDGSGTLLVLAPAANCPMIVIGDDSPEPMMEVKNVRVTDLRLDGNRAQQKFECWDGLCDTGEKTNIRSSGVVFRRAVDCGIERIEAFECRSGGVVTEKGCRRLTIRDLRAHHNEFDGLACYQTEDSILTGLHLHDNPFAGISLDWSFDRNVIHGAVLATNGGQGIFMRDSKENVFQTILIRDSGQQGIFIAQTEDQPHTHASRNLFNGLTILRSKQAAIRLNDASCKDNRMSALQLFDNGGGGISEATPGLVLKSE